MYVARMFNVMSTRAADGHQWNITGFIRAVQREVKDDVRAAMSQDPALTSFVDTILSCPGLHAVWAYRLTHHLWTSGGSARRLVSRVIATCARAITGIEIHPAAQIGKRLYIDHGMGVVIGETTIIGDDVLMYHGATLGGTSAADGRRHPRIGNRVLIGSGARVLGAVHVGDDARIGANVVVLQDVPAGTTAVGVPAHVIAPIQETQPDAADLT